jgi:hypothetical protein
MVVGFTTTYAISAYRCWKFIFPTLIKLTIIIVEKRGVGGNGIQCHFQQYFSYIVAISFIGGGNQNTQRKPPTCRKSLIKPSNSYLPGDVKHNTVNSAIILNSFLK